MNKRSTKWYRKNEAEVMKRLGFKPTKNSGAGWIEKCDGENDHFICELKSTDNESYTLKQNTLHELEYHAMVSHKLPVFALQFINTDEIWLMIKSSDIEQIKMVLGVCTDDNLQKEIEDDVFDENGLKFYCTEQFEKEIFEKSVDKKSEKYYSVGEGDGGEVEEVVDFMPDPKHKITDKEFERLKNNIQAKNSYLKQKEIDKQNYLKNRKQSLKQKGNNESWKRNYNKKV